jgi:hypothetical protein
MKEVKQLVVDTCINVITQLAREKKIEKNKLRVRIDLETIKSKPIFGLFDESVFLGKKSLNEIIKAGGGQGLNMILGTYIKKIIRDIFSQTMSQLKIENTMEMFILLYLKEEDGLEPTLTVYHNKEFIWSMFIGEAIEAVPQT